MCVQMPKFCLKRPKFDKSTSPPLFKPYFAESVTFLNALYVLPFPGRLLEPTTTKDLSRNASLTKDSTQCAVVTIHRSETIAPEQLKHSNF